MEILQSKRFQNYKEGIWKILNEWTQQARQKGKDIINLGIGCPDQKPANILTEKLSEYVKDPALYGYPFSERELHLEITKWYKRRFNVDIDPDLEVIHTIGGQEGLTNLPVALLNFDDILLYPNPGYPLYNYLPSFAYVNGYGYPLFEKNNYQIDLSSIPSDIIKKSRLMIINYPSNPLAAITDKKHLEEIVNFAHKNNIIILYDNTYCEIAYDGYMPPSILEIDGAKDVAVELHSFSKTYNLPGIRLGFYAGNREVIKILSDVKSNIDFGVFKPLQKLGAFALKSPDVEKHLIKTVETYRRRRDIVVDKLNSCGWNIKKPQATFYIFTRLPSDIKDDMEFVYNLIMNTGVVVLPGSSFGTNGKGYIRISLVRDELTISEAIERIINFLPHC